MNEPLIGVVPYLFSFVSNFLLLSPGDNFVRDNFETYMLMLDLLTIGGSECRC